MNEPGTGFNLTELWRNFSKKPSSIWLLLGVVCLGILLLMGGNERNNSGTNREAPSNNISVNTPVSTELSSEETRLEAELTKTLEGMVGVGLVRVDLNLRSGRRKVWERQARLNKRVTQEQTGVNTEENSDDQLVFAKDRDGRDNPILKEELAPEIQGAVIITTGHTDSSTRQILTETVMTILGLPAHRVMVISGSNQKGEKQ